MTNKYPLRKDKVLMGINIRRTVKREEIYKKLIIDNKDNKRIEDNKEHISDKDLLEAIIRV